MNKSTVKFQRRPTSTHDLLPSERRLLAAINELAFGRFELLRIQGGELVLDPWPTTVRYLKLGSKRAPSRKGFSGEFEVECPLVELFAFVRAIDRGEISLSRGAAFAAGFDAGNLSPGMVQSTTVQRG